MDSHRIGEILVIILLVVFSGYFSATETAFTSVNRIKIKNLAADGSRSAERVLRLSDHYDKLLTSILIGNNIVNITMTSLATVLFIDLYGSRGATYATIVITIVVLVFGEITPKSLAKESPENFSMFASGLIQVIVVILTPVNFVFSMWKKLILHLFQFSEEQNITEEELKTIVEEAETTGGIESDQSELIQNAIEFKELTAEEVMTPRPDIVAIDLDSTEDDVAALFKKSGFSRLPVFEGDLDKILGVLNQKDFHNYIYGNGHTISDFVKPVVFVAESLRINILLKRMQALKTHIAIVVDEYGGTRGLVTMEDIIEQLVGDIYDEHDVIMSQEVTRLQNGSYRVMCNASLNKVFDYFGLDDSGIDANTVNGWVVICLDRLPKKGDTFTYISGMTKLHGRVTKATDRKALEINLTVERIPEEENDERREKKQQ
ncbi:MAG: HlyC/CorC family transporter [Anaerovoracaceae bacterium]|jgi:putative hemolysin